MPHRSEEQLAKSDLIDTVRTIVRLRHRIAMRRELNEIESEALAQYEHALVTGKPFELDVARYVEGEL